jgi:hypothetical protein
MKKIARALQILTVFSFGLLLSVKADVVVLTNGVVINGKILQQDATGILMQTDSGTFRYAHAWIQDLKKEAATAPHVSSNGQVIPDWAQIVSLLANTGFAPAIQQVPATVISHGKFKNVPYLSFRCGYGDYEINIYGDLNKPAAIQIGAMNYLHQTAAEKTNCVNFICSVLADASDRKIVRALDWNQKDVQTGSGMTFETLLPGEMDSYGGWWVSVYNTNTLFGAQASDAELLAITQPRVTTTSTNNVAPNVISGQAMSPTEGTYTYGSDYGWTAAELAAAHPGAPTDYPSATGAKVYPRTYTQTAGTYRNYRR